MFHNCYHTRTLESLINKIQCPEVTKMSNKNIILKHLSALRIVRPRCSIFVVNSLRKLLIASKSLLIDCLHIVMLNGMRWWCLCRGGGEGDLWAIYAAHGYLQVASRWTKKTRELKVICKARRTSKVLKKKHQHELWSTS